MTTNSSSIDDKINQDFLLEYFKQIRSEINIRLQINVNLILQKIVTCGASLGFLISQKVDKDSISLVSHDNQLLGFALIPIIAILYDLLISRNIKSINLLANFVRENIEPYLSNGTMWETHLFEKVYKKNKVSFEGNLLSLLTLGTEIIAIFIYLNQKPIFIIAIVILMIVHYFTYTLSQKLREYSPEPTSPDPFF